MYDEDGYLFIVDRKKDMIISGGENIYSPEVENALTSHPKIAEASVIGVPDELWGEVVRAIVVPTSGQELTEDEIIEYCRTKLAGYKCPKSVMFVKALPVSAAGKVLKTVLRAQYGQP
jgi:acyl-CoA synthetase (AMP-forming)/AMP-acid ligase II